MSTPAIIRVEGLKGIGLYKHWDGYPESTLEWLEFFNKDFTENRGEDPSYKFAQLVRSSSYYATKFKLDDSIYAGWGIVTDKEQWNFDFEYTLKKDGTVEVK